MAHDRAIVRFARAESLREVRRYQEALKLIAQCRAVFTDYGDTRRHVLCGMAEAIVLQRMHKYREARDTDLRLLPEAAQLPDHVLVATLHNNIAHASIALGDYATAEDHLEIASSVFRDLKQLLRVARVELARGRVMLNLGRVEGGIAHLHQVREQFLRHGLIEEAGLCGLDIVDALLARDAAAEAEVYARTILAEFSASKLDNRAMTALGYLSEAIAAREASTRTVDDVRQTIASITKRPDCRPQARAGD